MFFNNCNCFRNKPCCCRQEKDCNKQENRPCCNIHDKCNEDSQEKCCCHIKFENRCYCDKERENNYDKQDNKYDKKNDKKECRCGQENKCYNRDAFYGYGFASYHNNEDYKGYYNNQNGRDFGGREFYDEQEKSNYGNQEYLNFNHIFLCFDNPVLSII